MTSKHVSSLVLLSALLSASQAAAQYPEQPNQAQPQTYQQPQQQAQQQTQDVMITDMRQDSAPAPAPSVARPGGFRLNLQGYVGFGGSATLFYEGEDFGSGDLDATFGLQVQGLIPIGDYVLVGPALSFRSAIGDGASDRVSIIGVDAAFGGHYAIALSDSMAIDPYLLFTLGLSVATDNEILGSGDAEFGLGFGFRAGATLWLASALGVNLGLGYQSAHFYPDTGSAGESAHLRLHEFALELGLALRFGE